MPSGWSVSCVGGDLDIWSSWLRDSRRKGRILLIAFTSARTTDIVNKLLPHGHQIILLCLVVFILFFGLFLFFYDRFLFFVFLFFFTEFICINFSMMLVTHYCRMYHEKC